ncbi:MAG: hypothetical protein AAF827_08700 [Cyanobacteria bacterium P01_D01_bin.6]
MPTSLAEFQSIFQQLQDRVVRLNSPDPVFFTGTAGEDLIDPPNQGEFEELIGNGGDDIIYGLGGSDIISGDDVEFFYFFRDNTIPDDFSAVVYGNDIIFGDEGDEDDDFFDSDIVSRLQPGSNQLIFGGLGDDWIFGESGNDDIFGGPERGNFADLYIVNARSDRDRLYGGVGDDFIVGGYDNDILVGGQGNDELIGSSRRGGQHQWDGIDILWGDEENGNGSSGADTFVLGESGERYYDDNFISDISSLSQGRGQYALIKDFNASAGDKIQLAAIAAGEYQTRLTTPASEFLTGADAPNALGTAIYYDNDPRPFNSELIAFVEGDTLLSLNSSSVIYS